MSESTLWSLSVCELGRLIRERELSPLDVVNAFFNRIEAYEEHVNSFICLLKESAFKQAKQAEKEIGDGQWKGPLHGIPYAVKDIFDVAGTPTTAGSAVWKDYVPTKDATVVRNLNHSGAILVGKLNMHELAFGIASRNPHFGNIKNPWDLSSSCGGSSGGSAAALSAGFVPLTLGSDTGGSIRIPSSKCGVVGLKPTYGLVSTEGVLPLAWSLDHVGPMGKNVDDVAITLSVIAPPIQSEPGRGLVVPANYHESLKKDLNGLVVGIPYTFFFENLREDVKSTVLKAVSNLEVLGAKILEIEIPDIIAADLAAFTILFSEAAACLEYHVRKHPQKLGAEVLENVKLGLTIPATRYIQAKRIRNKVVQDMKKIFSEVDIIAVPATSVDTFPIEAREVEISEDLVVDVRTAATRNMRFFNLAGNPVLGVPCGFSKNNLPVGMQLVGDYFGERKLLEVGSVYQNAFPLNPAVPDLEILVGQ